MVTPQVCELGEEKDLVQLRSATGTISLQPVGDMEHHLNEFFFAIGNIHIAIVLTGGDSFPGPVEHCFANAQVSGGEHANGVVSERNRHGRLLSRVVEVTGAPHKEGLRVLSGEALRVL